jgi:hypothetical protein
VSEDSDGRLGTGQSSSPELISEDDNVPAYVRALMRHFVDLRDNTHGGSTGRYDKADHFGRAVELLRPVAYPVLREITAAKGVSRRQAAEQVGVDKRTAQDRDKGDPPILWWACLPRWTGREVPPGRDTGQHALDDQPGAAPQRHRAAGVTTVFGAPDRGVPAPPAERTQTATSRPVAARRCPRASPPVVARADQPAVGQRLSRRSGDAGGHRDDLPDDLPARQRCVETRNRQRHQVRTSRPQAPP